MTDFPRTGSQLVSYPPSEKWDDWVEFDPQAWPKKVPRHYQLIPTICFNCEAACGLLAYVDKETGKIQKLEGNPMHPGSRGRNCAKGPATVNQVYDPDRILYPLKRVGKRGEGKWERVSWAEVLSDIGGRIRKALLEKRGEEVMYHVGRPGHDGYMDRVLQSWGIDGHNSHTNVCSASARLGYALWQGADRPSPDHANARFILLLSSHLETGHYFNPHAQRIIEGKMAGAKLAVVDPRLSNTASMADYWLPTRPGSEAALLIAMGMVMVRERRFDETFVRQWVNWQETLEALGGVGEPTHGAHKGSEATTPTGNNNEGPGSSTLAGGRGGEQPPRGLDAPPSTSASTITPPPAPDDPARFDHFIAWLQDHYAAFTPEFAERETGVPADQIVRIAREIADAGSRFSSHVWRGAASGNLGGWQVARALMLLHVLTGSIGTRGGVSPNSWDKFVPKPFKSPPPQSKWNELLYPTEWPLSYHELSYLLPHFLKEGRGTIDTYFTRVYNPVWTNPDGLTWIEVLRDESLIGLHACLTPTWSETAWYADYVLPMGVGAERHDLMSQETQAGRWIGFRQPVFRVFQEKKGIKLEHTWQANPGEVWEEDEWWIDLSWAIDPDGSMGIRQWFESPYRPGEKLTVDEYYQYIFERSVPGLPEAAAKEGLTPLEYMRKYGAFEVAKDVYRLDEKPLPGAERAESTVDPTGTIRKDGKAVGVQIDGRALTGHATQSRKLELYSATMADWKWPEYALPEYVRSHVHPDAILAAAGQPPADLDPRIPPVEWPDHARGPTFALLPTFRLPTLIHTRAGNAKWLYEISHRNPLWISPGDAETLGGIKTGDMVKVHTEIGYFVIRAWVTEGIRPGVLACSHHLGRWRLQEDSGVDRWSSALVNLEEQGGGRWRMRQIHGIRPWESEDPDTSRVWWQDAGVHQNLTFPVHPDPVSGMHCWHQVVKAEKAGPDDKYGDIFVDTARAHQVYLRWKAMARPAPGPGGLRRPLWFARAVRPATEAYYLKK